MFQTGPIAAGSQSDISREMAERLGMALVTHCQPVYAPDQRKSLWLFGAALASELLGVSGQFLRKYHAAGPLPEPEENRNGRRF